MGLINEVLWAEDILPTHIPQLIFHEPDLLFLFQIISPEEMIEIAYSEYLPFATEEDDVSLGWTITEEIGVAVINEYVVSNININMVNSNGDG